MFTCLFHFILFQVSAVQFHFNNNKNTTFILFFSSSTRCSTVHLSFPQFYFLFCFLLLLLLLHPLFECLSIFVAAVVCCLTNAHSRLFVCLFVLFCCSILLLFLLFFFYYSIFIFIDDHAISHLITCLPLVTSFILCSFFLLLTTNTQLLPNLLYLSFSTVYIYLRTITHQTI